MAQLQSAINGAAVQTEETQETLQLERDTTNLETIAPEQKGIISEADSDQVISDTEKAFVNREPLLQSLENSLTTFPVQLNESDYQKLLFQNSLSKLGFLEIFDPTKEDLLISSLFTGEKQVLTRSDQYGNNSHAVKVSYDTERNKLSIVDPRFPNNTENITLPINSEALQTAKLSAERASFVDFIEFNNKTEGFNAIAAGQSVDVLLSMPGKNDDPEGTRYLHAKANYDQESGNLIVSERTDPSNIFSSQAIDLSQIISHESIPVQNGIILDDEVLINLHLNNENQTLSPDGSATPENQNIVGQVFKLPPYPEDLQIIINNYSFNSNNGDIKLSDTPAKPFEPYPENPNQVWDNYLKNFPDRILDYSFSREEKINLILDLDNFRSEINLLNTGETLSIVEDPNTGERNFQFNKLVTGQSPDDVRQISKPVTNEEIAFGLSTVALKAHRLPVPDDNTNIAADNESLSIHDVMDQQELKEFEPRDNIQLDPQESVLHQALLNLKVPGLDEPTSPYSRYVIDTLLQGKTVHVTPIINDIAQPVSLKLEGNTLSFVDRENPSKILMQHQTEDLANLPQKGINGIPLNEEALKNLHLKNESHLSFSGSDVSYMGVPVKETMVIINPSEAIKKAIDQFLTIDSSSQQIVHQKMESDQQIMETAKKATGIAPENLETQSVTFTPTEATVNLKAGGEMPVEVTLNHENEKISINLGKDIPLMQHDYSNFNLQSPLPDSKAVLMVDGDEAKALKLSPEGKLTLDPVPDQESQKNNPGFLRKFLNSLVMVKGQNLVDSFAKSFFRTLNSNQDNSKVQVHKNGDGESDHKQYTNGNTKVVSNGEVANKADIQQIANGQKQPSGVILITVDPKNLEQTVKLLTDLLSQHRQNGNLSLEKELAAQGAQVIRNPQQPQEEMKKTKFEEKDIPLHLLQRVGITKEMLQANGDLDKLLRGEKTSLYRVKGATEGLQGLDFNAKLMMVHDAKGQPMLIYKGLKSELEITKRGDHFFTPEEKAEILKTGRLQDPIEITNRDGVKEKYYVGVDKETNELELVSKNKIIGLEKIKVGDVTLNNKQKEELLSGRPVTLTGLKDKAGKPYDATIQGTIDFSKLTFHMVQLDPNNLKKSVALENKTQVAHNNAGEKTEPNKKTSTLEEKQHTPKNKQEEEPQQKRQNRPKL